MGGGGGFVHTIHVPSHVVGLQGSKWHAYARASPRYYSVWRKHGQIAACTSWGRAEAESSRLTFSGDASGAAAPPLVGEGLLQWFWK